MGGGNGDTAVTGAFSQRSYLCWCREVEGTQPLVQRRAENGGEYELISLPFSIRAEVAINKAPLAPFVAP